MGKKEKRIRDWKLRICLSMDQFYAAINAYDDLTDWTKDDEEL